MNGWKLIFLAVIFMQLGMVGAQTRVIHPGEGAVIARAIQEAVPHDTLFLSKGIYRENAILIDKPVVLIGEAGTVVDGQMGDEIFVIVSDSVSLENLTVKNVGVSYLKDRAAIRLNRVSNVTIRNNRLLNTFFGIYLQKSTDCILHGNTITGAAEEESEAGNAIHIWQGERIRVSHNTLSQHRDGIYFEFVDESVITHNRSIHNMRYGLHFMFSNDDRYESNVFQHNGSGVAVMFSNRIHMENNEFLDNWGGASYGLLLKEISDGTIHRNRFRSNTVGIYAEGANRLTISENQLENNGKAMDMKGNSMDNRILGNNFIGNTFEVLTNSKTNLNHFAGNYWSQYTGYDMDKDGVGDLPHRPLNLFALITDKIPAAHMLLHSFLVHSLEVAERMFPQFIPEQLIDSQPQMHPYDLD
jgi:nitrous oxidase accessory protein